MTAFVPSIPDEPVLRQAVRAIVLDGKGRILLFKAFSDPDRSRYFWITPGGGVTEGESDEFALRRELAEECGLHEFEIGPCIWVREHVFPLPTTGQLLRQRERFYLVRVDSHEVDITGWDEFERQFMAEPRWWSLDEIASSEDSFAPGRLAYFLGDVVAGHIPGEPLETGI
jgi:8-oxo-dGTP pyrophosphatase MutT (NUDIX family)